MTGMRVRAGLVSVVYKKALRLSNDDQGLSSGEIINLMSVDSTRLQDFCTYGLIALSGPFRLRVREFLDAEAIHFYGDTIGRSRTRKKR